MGDHMRQHYTDYQGYVTLEFDRLSRRFTDATLNRHETRILRALYAVRPRLTPIAKEEN